MHYNLLVERHVVLLLKSLQYKNILYSFENSTSELLGEFCDMDLKFR
jgi:hypothetical protein